jgi:DNA-binding XRE family transcriptional regulator
LSLKFVLHPITTVLNFAPYFIRIHFKNPLLMTDRKEQAQQMYLNGNCSQRDIATTIGVSERTIYNWIKGDNWERLRNAACAAPALVAETMYSQLVELQNQIAARESGHRYPTLQEADLTNKLLTGLQKLKNSNALPQVKQAVLMFTKYIAARADDALSHKVGQYSRDFFDGQTKNGFYPYQIEYGPAPVVPPPAPAAIEHEMQQTDDALSLFTTVDAPAVINPAAHPQVTSQAAPVCTHDMLPPSVLSRMQSATIPDTFTMLPNSKTGKFEAPEMTVEKHLQQIENKIVNQSSGAGDSRKKPENFLVRNNPTRLFRFRANKDAAGRT